MSPPEFFNPDRDNTPEAEIFARNHPIADFAEHFAVYFAQKRGVHGLWDTLTNKLASIDRFLDTLKSG